MSSEISDDLEEAIRIVDISYDARKKDEPKHEDNLEECSKVCVGKPFGSLIPWSDREAEQLEAMRELIARYVSHQHHSHPLCLAVFGPPGSGKSFAVEEIQRKIERYSKIGFSTTTINLTQVSSPAELTSALAAALMSAAQEEGAVPIIFFDEFDAARDGIAYGWLGSFLTPMHDGEFLHNGMSVKLRKAIYVFAGGTASTMSEFASLQSDLAFRRAKGPDFISRLRGYLDVAGPNEHPRMLRRAPILRNALLKRIKRHGTAEFRIEQPLLKSFLQAGRYRHGARSIVALIELAELRSEKLSWDMLPDDLLVALHVDRGPFDQAAINGCIALSGFSLGGDEESRPPNVPSISDCWTEVTKGLWTEGATLAFAGGLFDGPGVDLVQLLIHELDSLPRELSRNDRKREKPNPRFLSFAHGFDAEGSRAQVEEGHYTFPEHRRESIGVRVVAETYLDQEEQVWKDQEGKPDWKARAIERFRRRLAVSEASIARFVIGGHRRTVNERPSGVIEEAIQSLALKRPIYLAGGFGGATHDLGVVLGLSSIRTGAIPESLKNHLTPEQDQWLDEIKVRLQPPPLTSLPVSPDEQVSFLREHALGGKLWPNNGLSPEENRALFRSNDPEKVRDLTVEGLRRVFSGRRPGDLPPLEVVRRLWEA